MQPDNEWENTSAHPELTTNPYVVSPVSPLASPSVFHYSGEELEAVKQPYSKFSIVFLIIMVLTFFTGLGSALFFPLLIVGGVVAYRSTSKTQRENIETTGHRNPLVSVLRLFLIVGGVIALCFVGLIALFFIALSTGNVRMGS